MEYRRNWSYSAAVTVLYIIIGELLYCWYEVDINGAGGMIGGLLLVLYSLPGALITGGSLQYRTAQFLGVADGNFYQYFWPRFIAFQVPILITAILIFVVAGVVCKKGKGNDAA
jgi:hypothetical protein